MQVHAACGSAHLHRMTGQRAAVVAAGEPPAAGSTARELGRRAAGPLGGAVSPEARHRHRHGAGGACGCHCSLASLPCYIADGCRHLLKTHVAALISTDIAWKKCMATPARWDKARRPTAPEQPAASRLHPARSWHVVRWACAQRWVLLVGRSQERAAALDDGTLGLSRRVRTAAPCRTGACRLGRARSGSCGPPTERHAGMSLALRRPAGHGCLQAIRYS